jgi:hypothetical protein
MKSKKLKGENEEKGEEKGKKTREMEHKSDLNLNINSFFYNELYELNELFQLRGLRFSWSVAIK